MSQNQLKFTIEDAEILWPNFSGRVGPYNAQGDKEFSIILPDAFAQRLAADGWNVKQTNPRDDESDGRPYITIAVGYKIRPPRIVLITSTGKKDLGEDAVHILDTIDISGADLTAVAYNWEIGGKSGIKAYLKTLYVTQDEDELDRKYASVSDGD